ncbi:MAG: TetR family transcriptional regulator [Solirubrobacterales bacterium]
MSESTPPRPVSPRAPRDPGRAERIIAGAMAVIATQGLERLTHRAVATEAGVPLGSTTYHFGSLDDIVLAAMLHAKADDTASLAAWAQGIAHPDELAPALAQRIMDDAQRSQMVANVHLYLAAISRPQFQEVAYAWSQVMTGVLERFVDEVAAETLSGLYDALIIRVMISGGRASRDEVERVIRRALAACRPAAVG